MKPLKNLILICCSCISSFVFAQDRSCAPIGALEGDTVSWRDEQGQHLLFMWQSDLITHEDEGTSSQSISVTHWLKEGNTLTEFWTYQDSITDCPVDVEVKFIAEPRFPDIDNDGYNEIYFIVQKSCKGDISPAIVQVIMIDHNRVRYFMEADQKLVFPDGTTDGGSYNLGDFQELPKPYQNFAIRYLKEHYSDTF